MDIDNIHKKYSKAVANTIRRHLDFDKRWMRSAYYVWPVILTYIVYINAKDMWGFISILINIFSTVVIFRQQPRLKKINSFAIKKLDDRLEKEVEIYSNLFKKRDFPIYVKKLEKDMQYKETGKLYEVKRYIILKDKQKKLFEAIQEYSSERDLLVEGWIVD